MAAGLVTPRLDLDDAPAARFHRAAYAQALATYAGSPAFRAIGVVRAGKDADESARLRRILEAEALPPDMASVFDASTGETSTSDTSTWDAATAGGAPGFALLLPQAGLLSPRDWIEAALSGVRTRWDARVDRLERVGGGWIARGADGGVLAEGAACVVALGAASPLLPQLDALAIRPSRGQVTAAPLVGDAPRHALLWGAYAAPLADGRLLFGATHDPANPFDPSLPSAADDDRNLAALAAFAPALAARIDRSRMAGRAGVRATTPDRLPYVGAVPDADAYRLRFAGLAAGRVDPGPPGPVHEGLYVLGGLGGRGLAWAPALAEALASEMLGEPGALEIAAAAALHPARMLTRELKRRTPTQS
jgi:tRNA 5-methylaminomethyl-2-thiouridine biosynthesis bifunctional protein